MLSSVWRSAQFQNPGAARANFLHSLGPDHAGSDARHDARRKFQTHFACGTGGRFDIEDELAGRIALHRAATRRNEVPRSAASQTQVCRPALSPVPQLRQACRRHRCRVAPASRPRPTPGRKLRASTVPDSASPVRQSRVRHRAERSPIRSLVSRRAVVRAFVQRHIRNTAAGWCGVHDRNQPRELFAGNRWSVVSAGGEIFQTLGGHEYAAVLQMRWRRRRGSAAVCPAKHTQATATQVATVNPRRSVRIIARPPPVRQQRGGAWRSSRASVLPPQEMRFGSSAR